MTENKQDVGVAACADPEMATILEAMLEADETITARAVARKHSSLGHASSITRNTERRRMLEVHQEQQRQRREWVERAPKRSRDHLVAQLAAKDSRIAELERQVEVLRISHLAMIRTVGELGGVSKLMKFYASFREIRDQLCRLQVLPHGEVRPFAG